MSLDAFRAEFAANGAVDRKSLNFFTNLKDNEEEKILVYYAEEKNVGIKGMRSFIQLLEEQNIQRGIMIWSEKMTSAARKVSCRMPGAMKAKACVDALDCLNADRDCIYRRRSLTL